MRFAVFCKSFRDDIERFTRLVASFERHNVSMLPLFVSVPSADRRLFHDRVGASRVHYINDEDVLGCRLSQSWHTQQLVKLQLYRTDFADAWFWLDSDTYFCRNFSRLDFVREDGSVAMVASRAEHALDENWELLLAYLSDESAIPTMTHDELCVFDGAARFRIPRFRRVSDALFRPEFASRFARCSEFFGRRALSFVPLPGAIWTLESLASFVRSVLEPRGLTFQRLLADSPWEARWLAEWEIYRGLKGRHVVNPPLVHIRLDRTIERARREGVTEARLASRYLGINLAARHQELLGLDV